MSVPKGKRSENKLEVFQKARKLVNYTCTICKNEKTFPPIYEDITKKVVNDTWLVFSLSWQANQVYIGRGCTPDARIRRRDLQNQAIELCESLLNQIEVLSKLVKRPEKKTMYWGHLVIEELQLLRKWRDSDSLRASKQNIRQKDIISNNLLVQSTKVEKDLSVKYNAKALQKDEDKSRGSSCKSRNVFFRSANRNANNANNFGNVNADGNVNNDNASNGNRAQPDFFEGSTSQEILNMNSSSVRREQ